MRFFSTVHPWIYCVQWTIWDLQCTKNRCKWPKYTFNVKYWKRWNDQKSIVEKICFFYWKKLHNLACISLNWDSTFQLNLIPTIWIHDMKSTWNRKVFLIRALKKTFKIWFTATNYPFLNIEICISLECWTFTCSWSWSCNSIA